MIWQEIAGPISATDSLVRDNKKKKKWIANENKMLCKAETPFMYCTLWSLRASLGKTENNALSKLQSKAIYSVWRFLAVCCKGVLGRNGIISWPGRELSEKVREDCRDYNVNYRFSHKMLLLVWVISWCINPCFYR